MERSSHRKQTTGTDRVRTVVGQTTVGVYCEAVMVRGRTIAGREAIVVNGMDGWMAWPFVSSHSNGSAVCFEHLGWMVLEYPST